MSEGERLTARLRSLADWPEQTTICRMAFKEAAAEIDRLRAELADVNHLQQMTERNFQTSLDDRERLRAELAARDLHDMAELLAENEQLRVVLNEIRTNLLFGQNDRALEITADVLR